MMQHARALKEYQDTLRRIQQQAQATDELSYHHALLSLLRALDPNAEFIHEPKRVVVGRPDFILLKRNAPAGFIEAEAFGADLDRLTGHAQAQVGAFQENLDNFLLTNFLEFRLYREGACVMHASLPRALETPLRDASATPVLELLRAFLDAPPLPIRTPSELARHLARRARQLKHILHAALETQLKQPPDAPMELRNLYRAFQETLLPDLAPGEFSDLYAQTIAYGLFAARCHAPDAPRFTRADAAALIPPTNPFLRRLFQQLATHDLEPELAWIADELAQLLQHADMSAILQQFHARLAKEDPIVHFYEDFLHEYDPALRELRGVYYTPEPVVRFIIRAVDDLLRAEFSKPLGVADPDTLILDPACGTGSFLYELIEQTHSQIAHAYGEGAWRGYVENYLLLRVFGFELLVAPYAVAHLKLALQLQQLGYQFQPHQRIGVYLTNTLEQAVQRTELLLGEYIAREANDAAAIKRDKPILVVLGNPPYSGHSANRSVIEQVEQVGGRKRKKRILTWIGELIEDYKQVDGLPLQEKNPKWLQDDYVKFIRWGEWRIQHTGEGILAFITNHAYLDNPTFRGMRAHLLRTFDRLYVLNLHGNARRKETAPDGAPDENVFDIQQGVAILIAVRRAKPIDRQGNAIDRQGNAIDSVDAPEAAWRVWYADVWGRREQKYAFLQQHTLATVAWTPLSPRAPMYLFVPQDTALHAEYERGWRIPDIFPTHSVGVVTARDRLTIHWTPDEVWRTVCRLVELEPEAARTAFNLGKDVRDWSVARAQADLRQAGVPNESAKARIQPILYRPFDVRYTFYTGKSRGFHCMPRPEVMRHLLAGENVALIVGRFGAATGDEEWNIVFVSRHTVDLNIFRRGGCEVHPLYLYGKAEAEVQGSLLGSERRVNLDRGFLEALGLEASPEQVMGYIYAVLHAPLYRSRYAEFLRRDFPRVPLPPSREAFEQLAAHGQELIALHLLEHRDLEIPLCKFPVAGKNTVERVRRTGERVWINATQYFEPVPEAAWAFRVGGYPVCEKWLADRKERTLSFDEILTYQRIVPALAKTVELQASIDEVCRAVWGW